MKFNSLLILAFFASLTLVQAQPKGRYFGAGIVLGEPTGLNAKFWLNSSNAVDVSVAWSVGKHDALHLDADYLFHNYNLIPVTSGKLPVFFGPGAKVVLDNDPRIGIRFPVGVNYFLPGMPMDLFFELAPAMNLLPKTNFEPDFGIGTRYYF